MNKLKKELKDEIKNELFELVVGNEEDVYNTLDKIMELIETKLIPQVREKWKKDLRQHFEQLEKSGWIKNDKDKLDALNELLTK